MFRFLKLLWLHYRIHSLTTKMQKEPAKRIKRRAKFKKVNTERDAKITELRELTKIAR